MRLHLSFHQVLPDLRLGNSSHEPQVPNEHRKSHAGEAPRPQQMIH